MVGKLENVKKVGMNEKKSIMKKVLKYLNYIHKPERKNMEIITVASIEIMLIGKASELTLGSGGQYLEVSHGLDVGRGGHN